MGIRTKLPILKFMYAHISYQTRKKCTALSITSYERDAISAVSNIISRYLIPIKSEQSLHPIEGGHPIAAPGRRLQTLLKLGNE